MVLSGGEAQAHRVSNGYKEVGAGWQEDVAGISVVEAQSPVTTVPLFFIGCKCRKGLTHA